MRVRGSTYGSTDGNKSNDKLVIQARLVPGLRHSQYVKASNNTRKKERKEKGKLKTQLTWKREEELRSARLP